MTSGQAAADRLGVHVMCGLVGSGKTTIARELEASLPAARFTLDEWMLRLYGLRFDDPNYPDRVVTCKGLITDIASQVLRLGRDVVLDWNHFSAEARANANSFASSLDAALVVHVIDVPVELAVTQMMERNQARRQDAHIIDADTVRHSATFFEVPSESEGFEIRRYTRLYAPHRDT